MSKAFLKKNHEQSKHVLRACRAVLTIQNLGSESRRLLRLPIHSLNFFILATTIVESSATGICIKDGRDGGGGCGSIPFYAAFEKTYSLEWGVMCLI